MSSGANEMRTLAADLTKLGARTQLQGTRVLRKTLIDIQAGAQSRAPVDTGYLRSSISHDVTAHGTELRGEVGPTANYGAHVEQGTRKQRPQPYLRPATDAALPAYNAALEEIGGDL